MLLLCCIMCITSFCTNIPIQNTEYFTFTYVVVRYLLAQVPHLPKPNYIICIFVKIYIQQNFSTSFHFSVLFLFVIYQCVSGEFYKKKQQRKNIIKKMSSIKIRWKKELTESTLCQQQPNIFLYFLYLYDEKIHFRFYS